MGNEISTARDAIVPSSGERGKIEERLNILEKMINYHLENAKISMLNGERSDQQIHTGTVVEFSKQVSISMSKTPSAELQDAIKDFFGGTKTLKDGFKKLVTGAVGAILGNTSMGEHEGSSMFIQWSDNALLRLDAYYYRWNFSSDEVIQDVEGASGVIVMKRVINLVETDPQVLTWAISRQAELLDPPGDASKMIDDAVAVIQKVNALRQAVKCIENEEHSKGMGGVCDHIQDLDGADIKNFCEKPKPVKCPQCTLLLTVISDGIYICLSCGKQACKKHIAVKSDACDCSLVQKINTNKIWCLECNILCVPKLGDALFKRYQTECVHLQRNYFAKEAQPVKFRISPFLKKCRKCTDSPEKNNILICLECGKKTCCIEEAKLHNILNFYHYLSIDISTKLLHCHNCQKKFKLDECNFFERNMHLKQRCKDTLSYNEKSSPTKPLPLYNTGNICYFIAIVQNLRNCTQLNKCYASVISGNHFKQNYVIYEKKIEVDCEVKPVTAAVLKVLNANSQRELQLCVQDLMNLIRQRNKRFAVGTQQDSHEALRQIFDELREEEINNVKSEIHSKFKTAAGEISSEKGNDSQLKDYLRQAVKIQTVVDKVFGGKTVNTVICRECFNVLQIIEPQLDFSLPLSDSINISENQSEKKPTTSFAEDQLELRNYLKNHNFHHQHLDKDYPVEPFTIEQCLQSFTTLDILDENNKFVCDKCVSTKAECLCSKQLLIHSLPPVLILHLKRFHLYPKVAKNNTHVKFPLVLNMAPFCTDKCFELISPGKADDMKGKILYALKGVIVHEGSLQFGHYYTFLRTTEKLLTDYQHNINYDECPSIEGDWYCANDNNITRVSDLQSGMPASVGKSSGYLLFYERLSLIIK